MYICACILELSFMERRLCVQRGDDGERSNAFVIYACDTVCNAV